jgi:hypothetical protein
MHIPIDNLYDWISGISHDLLIYRFYPHGSKNLECLNQNDARHATGIWINNVRLVPVICYDQEPLDHARYANLNWQQLQSLCSAQWPNVPKYRAEHATQEFWEHLSKLNLASVVPTTMNDCCILLHTEQRSSNLNKYTQQNFIPAYWWSHAMIAKDWYRFAKHDPRLNLSQSEYQYNFNIYSRAWSGTREYRLKFLEMLIKHNLDSCSRISFCDTDNLHYTQYQYNNQDFQVHDLSQLCSSTISSHSSASYDVDHYAQCAIDVVLETLFDDDRLYLTEKILRPIACGKPFILAGTHGSLEYLKSYGFKTFDSIIDERYDTIIDPLKRLESIVDVMNSINKLSPQARQQQQTEMLKICQYNREHFFSAEFTDQIKNELWNNVMLAQAQVHQQHCNGQNWLTERNTRTQSSNNIIARELGIPRKDITRILQWCRGRQQRSTTPSQV